MTGAFRPSSGRRPLCSNRLWAQEFFSCFYDIVFLFFECLFGFSCLQVAFSVFVPMLSERSLIVRIPRHNGYCHDTPILWPLWSPIFWPPAVFALIGNQLSMLLTEHAATLSPRSMSPAQPPRTTIDSDIVDHVCYDPACELRAKQHSPSFSTTCMRASMLA